MLTALRRGPASAATTWFSTPLCSQYVRLIRPRAVRRSVPRTSHPLTPRAFGTSSPWRQSATASAEYEEAVEGELEQEVNAEEPPSDTHIDSAIRYGPVTKFEDLASRGLVCQTVVETITKDMGLHTMTQVQSLTLNESLKGIDM